MVKMPVGISDYRELIQEGYYFVDKTSFIAQLIDNHAKVTLFTRPRRFGKTLTLSMVNYFFNVAHKDEAVELFRGTKIALADKDYMSLIGKKPVVFLSLKDIKANSLTDFVKAMGILMQRIYGQFTYLRQSEALDTDDVESFNRIRGLKADSMELQDSLRLLIDLLWKHYGCPVLLLLDEYDAPIQYAWEHGYYDQAISFMRNFLSSAFKDNPSLDFALITGVLRIAKESIFSGLNNFKVSTVTSGGFADSFGFTKDEVRQMAIDTGHKEQLAEIAEWYDGYNFQGVEIYNPWSVINYFDNSCEAEPYWVNTSSNGILSQLIADVDETREQELLSLLSGGHVTTSIHESIVYGEIGSSKDDLYTILLLTGYLKSVGKFNEDEAILYELAIPNKEIRSIYRREILGKLTGRAGISVLYDMMQAMLKGKTSLFASYLKRVLRESVSVYDAAKPESFYHGLMLGITVWLEQRYIIRSNRESGYGRFDLALIPKQQNLPGVIMEFKAVKSEEEMEKAAIQAKAQIEDKAYVTDLEVRGVTPVWTYGIAFCGKDVLVLG